MVNDLDRLESDVMRNPDVLDKLFSSSFDIANMVGKARDLGYELDVEQVIESGPYSRVASTRADVTLKVPDAEQGMRELTLEEVSMVGGGLYAEQAVVYVAVTAVVAVEVAVVAVVLAVVA